MPGRAIEAREQRALTPGIKQIRVLRMRSDVAALASANRIHRAWGPSASAAFARHAKCRVVLLRAANVIREVLRRRDVVELRRGILLPGPRFPAVDRYVSPPAVAVNHSLWVVRGDPDRKSTR